MTRGRTSHAAQHRLDLIAVVVTEAHADDPDADRTLSPEHVDIVELCRDAPQSVAELAAELDLPVGVVRVLIGDLVDDGTGPRHPSRTAGRTAGREHSARGDQWPSGALSAAPAGAPVEPVTLKILVAGGFGVGKTTLVGAVSEIKPLRTEEMLTEAGRPVDDTAGVEGKTTTTVAMDFGRITLREDLVLYLFGTPGQDRFWFLWDELATGALGAVVLADTRRLEDSFAAIDYFERRSHPLHGRRQLLRRRGPLPVADRPRRRSTSTPRCRVVLCDARDRESVKEVLIAVVEHAMAYAADRRADPAPADDPAPRPHARRPVPPPTGVRAAVPGARARVTCRCERSASVRRPPASRSCSPPPCASCGTRGRGPTPPCAGVHSTSFCQCDFSSSRSDHTPVARPAAYAAPRQVVSDDLRPDHRHPEHVRLVLHQQVVRGHAAVHLQGGDAAPRSPGTWRPRPHASASWSPPARPAPGAPW